MRINIFIVTLILTILSGCGSLSKKAALINHGYTKEDVLKIMGPPEDRQFKGANEAWQYCETDAGISYDDFRIVWFHGDKVTGLTSYKQSEFGVCAAFFKSIQWDDAPDRTIEIRKR